MSRKAVIRAARIDDADVLAKLVNDAGEGLPLHLWGQMAEPGESPWDVGRRRARRDEGAFSWRNALVIDEGHGAVGCLIGYAIDAEAPAQEDLPPIFVPLDELERLAPDTWYINVIAVLPGSRGRGHGSALLGSAARTAEENGLFGISLIVSDANSGAIRLYERHGFAAAARREMVKDGWQNPGRDWILMTRAI